MLPPTSFGTLFNASARRSDPLSALFWFFVPGGVHPDLPGFGMISHVVSTFSKRRCSLFGMAMRWCRSASSAPGVGASHVHGGPERRHQAYFVVATMSSGADGIKVFSWMPHVGRFARFKTPMLWAIASSSCSLSVA